ncbi:MAG: hypothetical protein LAT77_02475 [Aliidiomarina sp.]|uniref:Ig-like domain-containing protein n=1 Tax=Aliidiomarina sp. TaxID=1872439 RepID=UPI0025C195FF|nr:Ig-like domain-containing protein [Aliidiomarina sp.]MCH8500757.1 hypothetical protein [Aliidiomarina sp.]
MNHWKNILAFGLTAALVGCGGGGGSEPPPEQRHLVQAFAYGPGKLTPNAVSALHGRTYVFTLEPYDDFVIHGADGCNGRLDGDKYTVGPVTAPCDFTAYFGRPPIELAFHTEDVETLFRLTYARDEFENVSTFTEASNLVGWTSEGDYRFIAEANVDIAAYDVATSPDGRYVFLALGGTDSENYFVHTENCGLVRVDRSTDEYACMAPDLIFAGFDSTRPRKENPILRVDPRTDEQGNWVGVLYFFATTYTVTGDCEFTGWCRVARDNANAVYQLDLDGHVEAITPTDQRVFSMHANPHGELFIEALTTSGDDAGYVIQKYSDGELSHVQSIASGGLYYDDADTVFALDRNLSARIVHADADGIERADFSDSLRGPFGFIFRGPHGRLFNQSTEPKRMYSILPPQAEPIFYDESLVFAGLSHLGSFKAVYGDWFLAYMAEARAGNAWEQEFIMMINAISGETRRLLLPLNLGQNEERSYGLQVIGDQLFVMFTRPYASQHWVQVVNLAELLAGADEEEVSKATYFRWRSQFIEIDNVIDLRIPDHSPSHETTGAAVIFDKALGSSVTIEFSQAVDRDSVEANLQLRHASTHAEVPYLPVWLENTLHLVVSLDGFENEQRTALPADQSFYLSFGAGMVDAAGRAIAVDSEVYLDE